MPSRIVHLQKLITNLQRRLDLLEERRALLGLEAPPSLIIQIEDIQAELVDRQADLAALQSETGRQKESARTTAISTRQGQPDRENMSPEQAAGTESPARVFICYKRHLEPDQDLAAYLYRFLGSEGHTVFFDLKLKSGQNWLEEIDRQIKSSDFMIVLLSEEAAQSEMVQAEVRRAYDYRQLHGQPYILPVRMAYEGLLPYAIDVFLEPLQYVVWQDQTDNESLAREIRRAMAGQLPRQTAARAAPASRDSIISEDGYPVPDEDKLHPPLPACDPRFLEELEAPGGTVKLRDRLYVAREADAHLKREIVRPGTITTIRASRQTGKSSLLVRGAHHARQQGAKVVSLDLQRMDTHCLETYDRFLECLAGFLVRKLRLDPAEMAKIWRDVSGPQVKVTSLLEDYILPVIDGPIVLALDEADMLLQTDFHSDFFGMLRSWHNSAAYDETWEKLSLVLVISTEPYLLITEPNQSPFNAGLKLYLQDFTESQVRDLNRRHGAPVGEQAFPDLMKLLNGHPYLTRKALYTLVIEGIAWDRFTRSTAADDGPFGDHLRRQQWLLRDEPALRTALMEIIQDRQCADEMSMYRLLRAGLVKRENGICTCRCDLYRIYFAEKLG